MKNVYSRQERGILSNFRCGSLPLAIETSRYTVPKTPLHDRLNIVKTAQIRNGPGQNGPNPKRPSPKRPNFFGQNGPNFFFFIRNEFNLRIWAVYISKTPPYHPSYPPPPPIWFLFTDWPCFKSPIQNFLLPQIKKKRKMYYWFMWILKFKRPYWQL